MNAKLDYHTAVSVGFPRSPRTGQRIVDSRGVVWQWFDDDSGLGALGFWGALVSAIAGPILGGIFGKKSDDSARQALQQQQQYLDQLKQAQAGNEASNKLSKHDAMKIALGILLLMFLFK
jgi:hypothetical protein